MARQAMSPLPRRARLRALEMCVMRRIASWIPISAALALTALTTACGGSTPATDDGPQDTGGEPTDSASRDDTGGTGGDTAARPDTGGSDDTATTGDGSTDTPTTGGKIQTVFIIMLENHSWSDIKGKSNAPYINDTLLKAGAHAENYKTPPGNHPSEPNYIWLEAGDNLGITNDNDPSSNHKSVTDHFVSQLTAKGISWKAYAEDIDGKTCPLTGTGQFAPKHTPQLFFDDVTDTNKTDSAKCIAHVRPYGELVSDLTAGKAAQYNFITPNLCNDMHGETFGTTCPSITTDLVQKGDDWLKAQVPKILDSAQYKAGGALFIIWDEGSGTFGASDGPIGMIVLSPFAKAGYSNSTAYTHSSTLRTFETIFGVPFLRGAATATDLGDMFKSFP
jgi:phospholipase C